MAGHPPPRSRRRTNDRIDNDRRNNDHDNDYDYDDDDDDRQDEDGDGRDDGREAASAVDAARGDCKVFVPFPRQSVSLVTGVTNAGKTRFVCGLVLRSEVFFEAPVARVIFVSVDETTQPTEHLAVADPAAPLPEIEFYLYSDFSSDLLRENDLVVFDDVRGPNPHVDRVVDVQAHHTRLAAVFIVTHSLIRSSLFGLLYHCHRLIVVGANGSHLTLLDQLKNRFLADPESRARLLEILLHLERSGTSRTLSVELSPVRAFDPRLAPLLAFCDVERLATHGYCLLFPKPCLADKFAAEPPGMEGISDALAERFPYDSASQLPPHTFVAVSADSVVRGRAAKRPEALEPGELECADRGKDEWDSLNVDMLQAIGRSHPPGAKRAQVEAVFAEILSCRSVCIARSGRHFFLRRDPLNTQCSLLDFLGEVTRHNSPAELQLLKGRGRKRQLARGPHAEKYARIVRKLIDNGARAQLFTNKFYLPPEYR